jgi:predicted nucleic acid-binding protein
VLAGTNQETLQLTQAFLSEFRVIDAGTIPRSDWESATRRAKRIPRDGKPRQLGDCLIRAIAERLHYDLETFDKRLRQHR